MASNNRRTPKGMNDFPSESNNLSDGRSSKYKQKSAAHACALSRSELEENFAKEYPTHDPNPDELLFLGGYEGELLREIITERTNTARDETIPT